MYEQANSSEQQTPAQPLEDTIRGRSTAVGGWISVASEGVLDLYNRAGYDFIGFDCQHGALSEADMVRTLRLLATARTPMLVRVSTNSPTLVGQVLDAGADGVIVPMVSTADEAAAAVAACRFPPHGIRSFGPMRSDIPLTPAELSARASCFVMIETADGLENAEEICAVPGVSGVIVGPGDLSIAVGLDPMQGFTTDQLRPALTAIYAACERNRLPLGIFAASGAEIGRLAQQGVRLFIVGSDMGLLTSAVTADIATARGALASIQATAS